MNQYPETFPPELNRLLALLRTGLGTHVAPLPAGAVNPTEFLALVRRHRAAPFLHRCAGPALKAELPAGVVRQIDVIAQSTTLRALAQLAEQVRLTDLLHSAGIATLTVKGAVLAQQLHGGPGGRHVGDIDLVASPREALRADALLRRAGLRRTRPNFELTPRQAVEYLRLKPEFEYTVGVPPIRVELLWRLEGLPEVEALLSRTVPCVVSGRTLATLPADLNTLYLCQHGARHGWFRLFWLLDVALLLRDPTLDWSAIAAEARRTARERPLLQAAALAHVLLGLPLPAALCPHPGERNLVARLAGEACRQIARDAQAEEGIGEWTRQLSYRTRLQPTPRTKFAVLAPHLFSPESWRMWPLPDRWFFLYYFATPVLWLWRRLRR